MSYAGAAANVVGGELQGWANVLERHNIANTYRNELAKQQDYANQAMQTFNPQASSAQAMMAGVGQGAQNRMGAYNQIGQVPLGVGPSPGSGYKPDVANAYTNMMGQARANLGGYSDWAVQQAINNLNVQRQLDQITNFAGGQSKNVFPLQMYKAQHSMDDLSMAGQAISSIGGGAANYAQFAQAPQGGAPGYYPVGMGGVTPAMWSGYGGLANLPPQGTAYAPYTDQSTIGYGLGGFSPG